ncbi:hypothetical protein [Anaerovibrio lipolyticus]|uniref:hypothetical protein n=1 Tax=Anaerovibrio lipolyticus TaxID=82374 RepID=UPI0026EAE7F2|nr:hypothetical protein [Anaerovibrio lipolyticus]MBE6106413.1 hypothetical protein [Anaerovibrio lipolyticus]
MSVSDKENELRELFYDRLAFLNRVRGHSDVLVPKIEPLNINYNLEKIKMLLQRKIEKPTLSDREKYLFGLIENGDILHIEKMKKTFENPDISQCPFCLQEIESKYKYDLVKSIEKVLSKEVDEHKNELEHNRINKVEMDFTSVEVIESKHLVECKIIIEKINEEVCRINSEINRKLENPYESISDFISIFPELLQQYEDKRAMLEADIEKYNTALINIKR